jgi:hypothetical protein
MYIIPIKADQQQKIEQITSNYKFKIYYISGNADFGFNFTSNKTGQTFANKNLQFSFLKGNNFYKLDKAWEIDANEDFTFNFDNPQTDYILALIGVREDV